MRLTEAIEQGTTRYPLTVRPPGVSHVTGELTDVLKRVRPGGGNQKLHGGRASWRVGPYKGQPLYSLTLVERETCPRDCGAWALCYGNNMPWATRFSTEGLMPVLDKELDALDWYHPKGYSVRLHVLGDFYSMEYVAFWHGQLHKRPGLGVYGYTHVSGALREAIEATWLRHGHRFNILQSQVLQLPSGRPRALLETDEGAELLPTCPEQTGKVPGCLVCGLCTLSCIRGVTFLIH